MQPLEKEKILLLIGNRIRKARLQSDKTSKEIAAHLKITTQAYGKMERGRCDICITRLLELARFHNTSVVKLLPDEYHLIVVPGNFKLA